MSVETIAEHLGMGDRAADVIRHEPRVEDVVLARRVTKHALVERQPFVPEPAHVPLACSAGVSAAVSLTTSVPVPSFVNTSSSRLSGNS